MKRRSNIMSTEVGLVLALGVAITAFSVDARSGAPVAQIANDRPNDPIILVDLPPTVHRMEVVPVVPPPADLPPVEVKNGTRIIEYLSPDLPNFPVPNTLGLPIPEPPNPQAPPAVNLEPEYEEPPFVDFAEVMPELIGGIEVLQASITYPEFARSSGIEGRVMLQFIVNTDGSVSTAEVTRGIGGGCDEAALEAIRSARFTPGLQRGMPVRVRFALPVTFRLR